MTFDFLSDVKKRQKVHKNVTFILTSLQQPPTVWIASLPNLARFKTWNFDILKKLGKLN